MGSIRQTVSGDFAPAVVAELIGAIGHTVVNLDPLAQPITLQRLWCIYEIGCTVDAEALMHFTVGMDQAEKSKEEEKQEMKEALATMRSLQVHIESCEARNADDKDKILAAIEQKHGIAATNATVQNAITGAGADHVEAKWKEWDEEYERIIASED